MAETTLCTIHFNSECAIIYIKRKFKRKLRNEIKWTNGDKHLQKPTQSKCMCARVGTMEQKTRCGKAACGDEAVWQSRTYTVVATVDKHEFRFRKMHLNSLFSAPFSVFLLSYYFCSPTCSLALSLNHPIIPLCATVVYNVLQAPADDILNFKLMLECNPRETAHYSKFLHTLNTQW